MPDPVFFATPAELRRWFQKNHARERELWLGYHKKGTGKPSVDWPQSVDQALCFGWIDGVRKSLGPDAYMIRFTPRRPGSIWSSINIGRVKALEAQGLMRAAGRAAFAALAEGRSRVYSYEQRNEARLPPELLRRFKAESAAWKFFQAQAPSYQRMMTFWIASAKRPETQEKRLSILISECAAGRRIPAMGKLPEATSATKPARAASSARR